MRRLRQMQMSASNQKLCFLQTARTVALDETGETYIRANSLRHRKSAILYHRESAIEAKVEICSARKAQSQHFWKQPF